VDVCHKQFGAEPAWKLLWCHGTSLAVVATDSGEVLNYGRPHDTGSGIPEYGAQSARRDSWRVIQGSHDLEYKQRMFAACKKAEDMLRSDTMKNEL